MHSRFARLCRLNNTGLQRLAASSLRQPKLRSRFLHLRSGSALWQPFRCTYSQDRLQTRLRTRNGQAQFSSQSEQASVQYSQSDYSKHSSGSGDAGESKVPETPAAPAAKPPKPPGGPSKTESKGLFDRMKAELGYLKEYAGKFQRSEGGGAGPSRRARSRAELEAELQKLADHPEELLRRKKKQEQSFTATEVSDEPLAEDDPARQRLLPVVMEGQQDTKWDQRLRWLREKIRGSAPLRAIKTAQRTIEKSEDPLVSKVREMKTNVQDKVSDMKEFVDTTQHPLIAKWRDTTENLMGETQTGFVLGEIMKQDPEFSLVQLIIDLEETIIPLVLEGYLKPVPTTLQSVCEDNAWKYVWSTMRERDAQGLIWDPRVLDIRNVEFLNGIMRNEQPYLVVQFMAQHVNCVKNKKGEIVQGGPSDLQNAVYTWALKRDLDSIFGWTIVEFHTQRVNLLV